MAGRDARTAIDPSGARQGRSHRPPRSPPQCAPDASDRFARLRCVRRPETRPHPLPDAKIDGEEVSRRTSLATSKLSYFPYLKIGVATGFGPPLLSVHSRYGLHTRAVTNS